MYDSHSIKDKNKVGDEYNVLRVKSVHILCEVEEYYSLAHHVELKMHIVKCRPTTNY